MIRPATRLLALRTAAAAALSLGLLLEVNGADSGSFTLGTATARAGEKATGVLRIPAGTDPGLEIPVAVVRGSRPGPVLALVSGAHGTEYASILAVERLISELDASRITGTVLLVPLVNVSSFEQKVPHVNPVDGKSMNRFYPGRADGTQTERASFVITRDAVDRCDYLIDLHGGDLDEDLRPYSYWIRTGNAKQDAVSRAMVLAFGLDHIIVSDDRPKDPAASRYLDNTASLRGKPAIAVEAGRAGTTEPEDVGALVEGCLSVMRHLRMLPGAARPVEHPVWIGALETVASGETGIFHPLVRRGTFVAAGMRLGYVTDYVGRITFEARAPKAGVVLYVGAVPSMKKGETIANIGIVADGEP